MFKLKEVKEDLRPQGLNNLSQEESRVYCQMTQQPIYIDELANQLEKSPLDMMKVLLQLELKQYVKQLPGKYFVRQSASVVSKN